MGKKQAIMKAVEVDTSVGLDIGVFTHPDFTVYPTQSLFPNILALAADLHEQIYAITNVGPYITPAHLIVVISDGNIKFCVYNFGITDWYTPGVYDPLGFAGAGQDTAQAGLDGWSGLGIFTIARDAPQDTFLPNYYTSDSWYFVDDAEDNFKGVTGVDGNLSGASFTPRAMRNFEWKFQTSTNAIKADPDATAIQSDRSFENIINSARANSLQISTDNTYCKGVYLIDDVSVYYAESTDIDKLPTSWGSGSTTGDYIFCSAGVPNITGASMDNTKNWYDCSVKLTTAVSPTWTWDIS